jgi:hypothetical protein
MKSTDQADEHLASRGNTSATATTKMRRGPIRELEPVEVAAAHLRLLSVMLFKELNFFADSNKMTRYSIITEIALRCCMR